MTGIGHLIVGSSITYTYLNISGITDEKTFLTALVVGSISSLLPDLDSRESLLKSSIKRQSGKIFSSIFELASNIFSHLIPHRGITHYLVTPVVIFTILAITAGITGISIYVSMAFLLGYISHIFADSLTKAGVKMFVPFSKETVHFLPEKLRIKTGKYGIMSLGELTVVAFVVFVISQILN